MNELAPDGLTWRCFGACWNRSVVADDLTALKCGEQCEFPQLVHDLTPDAGQPSAAPEPDDKQPTARVHEIEVVGVVVRSRYARACELTDLAAALARMVAHAGPTAVLSLEAVTFDSKDGGLHAEAASNAPHTVTKLASGLSNHLLAVRGHHGELRVEGSAGVEVSVDPRASDKTWPGSKDEYY